MGAAGTATFHATGAVFLPFSALNHLVRDLRSAARVPDKRFLYVIQSERAAAQHYVGVTWNVMTRLASHNAGESPHTRRYRPWRLAVAMAFATEEKALAFQRYLKSAAGDAFLRRHLL